MRSFVDAHAGGVVALIAAPVVWSKLVLTASTPCEGNPESVGNANPNFDLLKPRGVFRSRYGAHGEFPLLTASNGAIMT